MKFKIIKNDKYLQENKENVAFIFQGTIKKEEIKNAFNTIVNTLGYQNWVKKTRFGKKLKIYESSNNFYDIETKDDNAKFFYIMKNQISVPVKNSNLHILDGPKKTPYLEHVIGYGLIEKEINGIGFLPYIDELVDDKHLLDENYYVHIEELIAKEKYKKGLYCEYDLCSSKNFRNTQGKILPPKVLSAYEGYSIWVLENNLSNSTITQKISKHLNATIDDKYLEKIEVNNVYDALMDTYEINLEWLDNLEKKQLDDYLNKIEEKLGKFNSYYKVNYSCDIYSPTLFDISCFLYEKAIVVIFYETYE